MKDNQKVFIRGVKGRGEEVINALKAVGGKINPDHVVYGDDDQWVYLINHSGFIDSYPSALETGKIIMDCYTELHLPEKWKDGDVLVSRSDSQVMALYEFVSDKDADLFNAYFRLDDNMIFLHSLEVRNRFRLATDQEVERFYELLHKHHKDWDADKKQVVDWKWKPKMKEYYYYLDNDSDIMHDTWDGFSTDDDRYNFGNCFRTEEEAEAMREKVKKLLKGE